MSRRPRVLVLSRNYPNPAFPTLGLWAARLVEVAAEVVECRVLAPVPWAPPLAGALQAGRFRSVPRTEDTSAAVVLHPRMLLPPGHRFHAWEARLEYPVIRRAADAVRRAWPFDLIHGHFIYPDGVMAARLGRRYGVPVVTTEHALWQPWLDTWPSVRRQVLGAASGIARVTAVSTAVEQSIRATTGDTFRTCVLPNVVDDDVFVMAGASERWDPDRILFVGAVRHVKGLDILVRAVALLAEDLPALRLLVIGEAFYGGWRKDEEDVRRLCVELGVADRVEFRGRATPEQVASAMRASAALVVPGRRESFSAVAIEALASGTPVVATRCGGPEEFLSRDTGRLVEPEDPPALAEAIREVLRERAGLDPARLRALALDRFGKAVTADRLAGLYREVLAAR